jgi:hypothetical protein
MHRYRIFYITLFFCLFLGGLKGQVNTYWFEGKITNAQSIPLGGVSIIIKNSSRILKYQITDTSGTYRIALNLPDTTRALNISAKLLGYKEGYSSLTLSESRKIVNNFVLDEQVRELDEVTIQQAPQPVTVKGDTTIFKLNAFRQGNEQTVEDIIKKLPGMSVDESGNISFKGNKVDKVLLDNEDFYKEKYKNLTQHFDQKNIDSIEAIENYVDEDILSNFVKSGSTVLNLKLVKTKGIHASGNLDVGLGTDHRYDVSSNSVIWTDAIKFMSMAALDNVSRSNANPLRDPFQLNPLNRYIQLVNSTGVFLPINSLNANIKGNNLVINPNFVFKPFRKVSLKGSGMYTNQKTISGLQSNLNYYGQNSFLSEQSIADKNQREEAIDYEVETKYSINSVSRVKNTLSYTHALNKTTETEAIEQLLSNSLSNYDPNHTYRRFSTTADYLRKRNASTILNLIASIHAFNMDGHTGNDFLKASAPINSSFQLLNNESFVSDNYLRVYKKNKSNLMAYTIGVTYNFEKLQTQLDYSNQDYLNSVSSKLFDCYIKYGISKTIKRFSFLMNASLHLASRKLVVANEQLNTDKVLPSITIKNDYRLSKKMSLSLGFNHDNNITGTNELNREIMLTGNRSYAKNSPNNLAFNQRTDATLFFTYNDLFDRQLSVNGVFVYGKRPVTASLYTIDLNNTNAIVFNGFSRPYTLANISFSKLVSVLSSTVKLELVNSQSSYLSRINSDQLQTFKNNSTTVTAKIQTGFKGSFNVDGAFSASVSRLQNRAVSPPPTMFQSKLNLYFSFKQFNISSKNNFVNYDKDIKSTLLYSTIKADYKIDNSKFSFGVELNNLFDEQHFVQQNRTDLYDRAITYMLNKRYFVLNCNYNF